MSSEAPASSNPVGALSGDTITINVKAPGDAKISISITTSSTVLDLKKAVADKTEPRVEPENQRLIYSGRVLKDEQALSEYKIQSGHSLHMVKGAARSAPPPSSASQVPSNLNAGQQIAGNPLAPLLNATNHIPAFNPFENMDINPNDPNMAMNMMNNPQFLQQMGRMLDNPEVLDQIINSDPRLQQMPGAREMLRSPMFRQMLTNPEMLRSMAQMMGSGGIGGMMGGGPGGGFPPGTFSSPPASSAATTGGTPAQAGETAQQQTPPFNPFAVFGGGMGGAGGAEGNPMAWLNSPMGQMAMAQMMAGGGGMFGRAGPSAPADTRPPEERFEVQLGQLQGMGFIDARQNIRALQASGGNVEAAIDYILNGN